MGSRTLSEPGTPAPAADVEDVGELTRAMTVMFETLSRVLGKPGLRLGTDRG